MAAQVSQSDVVTLKKRFSMRLQEIRCPFCHKLLCIAQTLCIIEVKCTRSDCGIIVRVEPM